MNRQPKTEDRSQGAPRQFAVNPQKPFVQAHSYIAGECFAVAEFRTYTHAHRRFICPSKTILCVGRLALRTMRMRRDCSTCPESLDSTLTLKFGSTLKLENWL